MNTIFICFLIINVFVQVTTEEITTNADTTDTLNKPDETTKNNEEIDKDITEPKQAKFDMKDFKVTKLKSLHVVDEVPCLANVDPKKIEAVKKSIRNHDGKHEYLHVSAEEQKIAECLKKDRDTTVSQDVKRKNNDENLPSSKSHTAEGDTKVTENNKPEAPNKTNITENSDALNTVEEDSKGNNATDQDNYKDTLTTNRPEERSKNKEQRRRDTEYKFPTLEYYDDQMVFDNTTCPDKVEVIDLELGEVKNYDLECEMITHWTGLAETEQMFMT